MKKLFLLMMVAVSVVACKQTTSTGYKITVAYPDDSLNGDTVYLTSYDSGDTLQTAVINGNTCLLEGTVEKSYYARLLDANGRHGFIVEPGEYTFNLADGTANSPLNTKFQAITKEMETVEQDTTIAEDETNDAFAALAWKAFEENRDNAIGPWAFYNHLMYKEYNEAQIDSVIALAPAEYANMVRVQKAKIAAHQLTVTGVGQPFTDFAVTGQDGKTVRLSDFVGKGKPVLLDFWASWCPPCRAEMTNLKAIKVKHGDKLDIVSVAVWDAPEASRKAVDELGMTWNVVIGNKNLTEPTDLYGVKGIPTLVLFDGKGTIVGRGYGCEPLIEKIESLAQ